MEGGWEWPGSEGRGALVEVVLGGLSREREAELDLQQVPKLNGYEVEWNMAAEAWMKGLMKVFSSGYLLTMDYGMEAGELFRAERKGGTLSCYYRHQRDDDPYDRPGMKDMTAHVNFSRLMELGQEGGWQVEAWLNQERALVQAAQGGFLAELEERLGRDPQDAKARQEIRQFQTLTHPGMMGRSFRFLWQRKLSEL
ncbi:MAG: hypothetical protein HC904_08480 [Blastochloris sp.]|nr:hypothetical protein [Blastochloris sp.]